MRVASSSRASVLFVVFSFVLFLFSSSPVSVLASFPRLDLIATVRDSAALRLTPLPSIAFVNASSLDSEWVLHVYPSVSYQSLLGFGGALTEAAAVTIGKLSQQQQQEILESYYGPTGIGYSLTRVPMGSCDFSVSPYSFDPVPFDYSLAHFDSSVRHDVASGLIPLIKRAQELVSSKYPDNPLRLFLTPWSPLAWMKTNNNSQSSDFPCMVNEPRVFEAWAQYFIKFLDAYSAHGINFWGLTMQNEPEWKAVYEACLLSPQQEAQFLTQYLGPALMKSQWADIAIMIFDDNKDLAEKWADIIYSIPEAAQYVWGLAFHGYDGDYFDHLSSVHANWPAFHLLATEWCNCGVQYNHWEFAAGYAHEIIGDLNNYAEGFTDWNIVLDQQGGPNHVKNFCNAPIMANISDNGNSSFSFQPAFYAIGQFSKYLPPGSTRIGNSFYSLSNPSVNPLEWTTFLTPDRLIVSIIHNPTPAPWNFTLQYLDLAAPITMEPFSIYTAQFSMDDIQT